MYIYIFRRACMPSESYRSLGFANYHLNVFAFSCRLRARRASGFGTSEKERKPRLLAEESSLVLVSLEKRFRLSLFPPPPPACRRRIFLIRSTSLRWLMKTVEYDSYAALTASYFITLPRGRLSLLIRTTRAFIWRNREYAMWQYRGFVRHEISRVSRNLPNAKFRIAEY